MIKLLIKATIAKAEAANHERTAKMRTYVSALLSGNAAPFWPHFVLISGSGIAGIAVGAGIIFESSEYSASVHRVAKWLVIVGLVIESMCTVCLFVFDEGVSSAQQSKIIALEERLAARTLTDDQIAKIAARLEHFWPQTFQIIPYWENKESKALGDRIAAALQRADWTLENPERYTALVGVLTGVFVNIDKGASQSVRDAAKELTATLNDNGIEAAEKEQDNANPSDRINMQIGIKP